MKKSFRSKKHLASEESTVRFCQFDLSKLFGSFYVILVLLRRWDLEREFSEGDIFIATNCRF
jgi:hypothetical protein